MREQDKSGHIMTFQDVLTGGELGCGKGLLSLNQQREKIKKQTAYEIKNTNPEAGRRYLKGTGSIKYIRKCQKSRVF